MAKQKPTAPAIEAATVGRKVYEERSLEYACRDHPEVARAVVAGKWAWVGMTTRKPDDDSRRIAKIARVIEQEQRNHE